METVIVEFEGRRVEAPVLQTYPDGDARVRLPNGRQQIVRPVETEDENE